MLASSGNHWLLYFSILCSGECLGSSSDEGRSELRYALWIAEFSEPTDSWTHAVPWPRLRRSWIGVLISLYLVQHVWAWLSCVLTIGFRVNLWHISIAIFDSHLFCVLDFYSLEQDGCHFRSAVHPLTCSVYQKLLSKPDLRNEYPLNLSI